MPKGVATGGNGAERAGQRRPRWKESVGELQEDLVRNGPRQAEQGASELSLTTLALGIPLTHFVAWVALANHIDPTTATYDLAIGMSVLQGTNG